MRDVSCLRHVHGNRDGNRDGMCFSRQRTRLEFALRGPVCPSSVARSSSCVRGRMTRASAYMDLRLGHGLRAIEAPVSRPRMLYTEPGSDIGAGTGGCRGHC